MTTETQEFALIKEGALCALSAARALCLQSAQSMPPGEAKRRVMTVRSELGLMIDGIEGKRACSTLAFELLLGLAVAAKQRLAPSEESISEAIKAAEVKEPGDAVRLERIMRRISEAKS